LITKVALTEEVNVLYKEAAMGQWAAMAGQAAAKGVQAGSASKAKNEAQDAYNKGLTDEAVRQYGELDAAEADVIFENHAQSLEAQKNLLEARSEVMLRSNLTGTQGDSVDLVLSDIGRGFSSNMSEILDNKERSMENIVKDAENVRVGALRNADRSLQKPYWAAFTQGTANSFAEQQARKNSSGDRTFEDAKRAVPARKTKVNKLDASQVNDKTSYA
jgi:hypothetical protein